MNNAELYEKNNLLAQRDAIIFLEEYGKKLQWKPSGGRVLDIGCGDGGVTDIFRSKYMPAEYSRVVGCDISENMIKFAKEHHTDRKMEFHVFDIGGKVPEAFRESFDHVVSFTALHWVKNQEAAFRNIHEVLADDGDCLLLIMPSTQIYDAYRILSKNSKWSEWLTDAERFISPYQDSREPNKDIANLLKKIGFKNIEATCIENEYVFEDETKLKNVIAAISPFDIPKEKLEAYLEDFAEVIRNLNRKNIESNKSDKSGITLLYKSLKVYARKGPEKEHLEKNKP